MEGDRELERLADLLRLSADVARSIGCARQDEYSEFEDIVNLIDDAARRMERLTSRNRILS